MNQAEKVTEAVRNAGGRINRTDLEVATGMEGQPLSVAVCVAKKAGWIDRDGADYVLKKGAPVTAGQPERPARQANAAKPGKPAKPEKPSKPAKTAPAAEKRPATKPAKAIKSTGTSVALSPRPLMTHITDGCRAVPLLDGGAMVIDNGFVVAELAAPQVAAIGKLFRA